MKKRLLSIILSALVIASTTMLSGCGNDNKTATADTATTTSATTDTVNENATEATLSSTDKAIVEAGFKVDKNGKITDKNGNEVKADEGGKIEVTNEKGETIKVSTSDVSKANDNNKKVSAANNNVNSNSNNSHNNSNNGSVNKGSNSSSSSSNRSSGKTNSSSSSAGNQSSSSNTSNGSSSSSSSSSSKDPYEGKTYHKAVYKTVTHPAEYRTEEVWVVDKEAYSYEEPIYEEHERAICNDCGADITDLSDYDLAGHIYNHIINGGKGSYRGEWRKVQTGTKTIEVPEEGHWTTKQVLVKEAYTETILDKEAGWY